MCDEGKLFSVFFPNWDGEVGATNVHRREVFSAIKIVQAIVDATKWVIIADTIIVQFAQRARDLMATVWFLDQKGFDTS